jgi:hypothetical protein
LKKKTFAKLHTVIAKKIADKNICGNNICGWKIYLFLPQKGDFPTAKIFTANIFIRKKFQLYGIAVCNFLIQSKIRV